MKVLTFLLLSAGIVHAFMGSNRFKYVGLLSNVGRKSFQGIFEQRPTAHEIDTIQCEMLHLKELWIRVERSHILYFMNELKCMHSLGMLRFYQTSRIYPIAGIYECSSMVRKDPAVLKAWNSAIQSSLNGEIKEFHSEIPLVSSVYAKYCADQFQRYEPLETMEKLVLDFQNDDKIKKGMCHSASNVINIPQGLLNDFQVRLFCCFSFNTLITLIISYNNSWCRSNWCQPCAKSLRSRS